MVYFLIGAFITHEKNATTMNTQFNVLILLEACQLKYLKVGPENYKSHNETILLNVGIFNEILECFQNTLFNASNLNPCLED